MDKKMKNFDRNIEQMMNEHEVAPPFGMWNRISAQLDAETIVAPAAANTPVPKRIIGGFIAGALLIGATLLTAYLVNNTTTKKAPVAAALTTTTVSETPAVNIAPAITEAIPVAMKETKRVARISKAKTIAKPAAEKLITAEEKTVAMNTLPANAEVLIPTVSAENSSAAEAYYFPAVDNLNDKKVEEKAVVAPVKKVVIKSDERERETVSNNIKFRPKKHRSFSYGRIIHKSKR